MLLKGLHCSLQKELVHSLSSQHGDEEKVLGQSPQFLLFSSMVPSPPHKQQERSYQVCFDIHSHQCATSVGSFKTSNPLLWKERLSRSLKEVQIQTPWTGGGNWIWGWKGYIGMILSLEFKTYLGMKLNRI